MNGSVSAFDAVSRAVRHAETVLFRPFDLGRWFTLGFLSFLQILPEYLQQFGQMEYNWSRQREEFGWLGLGDLAGVSDWISEHWTLVSVLGFFVILVLLLLMVLFMWLSA